MKLLVLHCHEAWVHQLGVLGAELDVVVGLPERHRREWDERVRPLPAGARTVSLEEARLALASYDCVVNHSISDLLDTREIDAPKLLVLHESIEGATAGGEDGVDARERRVLLNSCLVSVGGHAIAVSRSRAKSWGVTHAVVHNSAEPAAYPAYTGEVAHGVRVVGRIASKRALAASDALDGALAGIPLRIVGCDAELPDAPSPDWAELKSVLASHRFLVHAADSCHGDGYDMAILEAMAAGMPVITNRHPTTIVEHGVTGLVADRPAGMREHALRLLEDVELARELGANGRRFVMRHFSPDRFRVEFTKAIQEARKKWSRQRRVRA